MTLLFSHLSIIPCSLGGGDGLRNEQCLNLNLRFELSTYRQVKNAAAHL